MTRRWIHVGGCVEFVFGDSCGIVKWVFFVGIVDVEGRPSMDYVRG